MRTRIALAAAATAALTIGISSTVLAGGAAGAPSRATRPTHRDAAARAEQTGQTVTRPDPGSGAFSRPETETVPAFLAPALSAVHRPDARHLGHTRQIRREGESPAMLAPTGALAAHDAQMQRVIDAWRAAHPEPVAAPPPAPAPPPVPVTDATSTTTPDWACIRVHESGDRFNTPAVPGGAYGFLESTWLSLGYSGWPYEAPAAVQDRAVLFLYNELGWQPWSTRFVCGL